MEIVTKSAQETKALGRKIASTLVKKSKNEPVILALTGDLGSGKTTFVQGLAQGLGIKGRIISPTFIIMRQYKIRPPTLHHSPFANFYHVDFYRLEEDLEEEIVNLGLADIWGQKGNIVAIEWAEKIKKSLPTISKWIEFECLKNNERKIVLVNF